jgi:hypothetical protein
MPDTKKLPNAPAPFTKEQGEQFGQWYNQFMKIGSDIRNLLLSRHIYRETQSVILSRATLRANIFARWLTVNYATTVALGIRRAVDTQSKLLSLANLLRDMIAKPKVFHRRMLLIPVALKEKLWQDAEAGRASCIRLNWG